MKPCTCNLRHKITIQSKSDTLDSLGGRVTTWNDVTTLWAMIEPKASNEFAVAKGLQSVRTHKITIRYSATAATITTKHRIKFGNRYFNITGIVNEMENNNWFVISAVESGESVL